MKIYRIYQACTISITIVHNQYLKIVQNHILSFSIRCLNMIGNVLLKREIFIISCMTWLYPFTILFYYKSADHNTTLHNLNILKDIDPKYGYQLYLCTYIGGGGGGRKTGNNTSRGECFVLLILLIITVV